MALRYTKTPSADYMARESWVDGPADNAQLLVTTDPATVPAGQGVAPRGPRDIKSVAASYSLAVTRTAVITLRSRLGTAFDRPIGSVVITAGLANTWIPDGGSYPLMPGDKVEVNVPASGVAGTLGYCEVVTQALDL